jgi:hypothetical protein
MEVNKRSCAGGCAVVLMAGILSVSPARSQTKDSSAAAAPTPVVIGGFVDSYFSFNMGRPQSHANQLRNFDVTENQVTMANAELSVAKAADPVGFRVDLDFGPNNDLVQSGAPGSGANVGQAYATYIVPVGSGLTVDAGKFVTHMGFEVIKAKDDFNYSRSLLFALPIPYYHVGARASYPVSSTTTLTGYLYNSFNGPTVNSGKTFGFEAVVTPSGALTLIANYIGGPALPDSVSKKFRNVANLVVSYAASEQVTVVLDGVYGQENLPTGVALWKGVAGYVHYQLCPPSALTLRGELYKDPLAYTTGSATDLKEITLTYEYKPTGNLILRAEYRYDAADASVYDGQTGTAVRSNQATLGLGAIVVF